MTENDFRQLLARAEGEILDFKVEGYQLPAARNDFIKDVLSMANTPRDKPALIVFGVRWTAESGSSVEGLTSQLDDAVLQDAFGQGRVQPNPRYLYTPFTFEGKQVGVLEVPAERGGPYTPIKDFEGLQAGAVYYRRGTQNERAVGPELRRVFEWFQGADSGVPAEDARDTWARFLEAAHRFEAGATYILAADRLSSASTASLQALGLPAWRAVIDFDPDSDSTGLLSSVAGSLGHKRVVHRVVRGEYRVQPEPGTHWFFARGLAGRQETLACGNHTSWLKSYKQELAGQLERLAAAVSPSPVVAILLWSDVGLRRHLTTLIEELHGAFGEAVEVVVVSADGPSFQALAEEAGATFVRMSLRNLCGGIAVHYSDAQGAGDERCVLPTPSGAPVEVAHDDWLWLSEDLELLHRSVGLRGADEAAEFRRGAEVSWRNLQLRHDCDRDLTQPLLSQMQADRGRPQTVRVNLYHAPGAGGTTVSRRVAWDLHTSVPVAILRRCEPRDTAERISKVAALTGSSVVIVVDGGQHSERDIDDLYEFLTANQTPAILLQVLRRFQAQRTGKRLFWLDAQLSEAEADRFRDAYAQAVPEKRGQLTQLARRSDGQRNAFFFGLTAFGKDFRGLGPYVERRIESLTDEQRRIVTYIAISHYYGQQAVPAQAFAQVLSLPRSKPLDFRSAFAGSAEQALDLLVDSQPGEWRTAHHLVALEMIQQVLSRSNRREREAVWRQHLSVWGKDFAGFCRGDDQTPSDRLLELVRRVFIYRDNVEVLGTERAENRQFAHLVEDIPSRHGKIEMLRHLTECFPLEAHFHAHLGRFLGLNGDYAEALECIEFAISLQGDDHVLHHMRGIALRNRMRAEHERNASTAELIETAMEAAESFEAARRLAPDIEHGYIGEVQLLVDLVDRAGQGKQDMVRDLLARPDTHPFLRVALERAEDLLDEAQHLYAGEGLSRYALDCRARLQRVCRDYQSALQAWDSLLARTDVAKPPVRRQIVWTILRRRDGAWEKLERKEAERVRHLLEENLEEEVNDSTSLRLWLRAIRQVQSPPTLDSVIEKVSYWKTNTGSLDAAFYLYVLHLLRALEGSFQGAADAERALEECRGLSRFRRDRTRSFEWIGAGDGVTRLVHQSRLGDWKDDFWERTDALVRVNGRVSTIDGAQKGLIELAGGVQAFFVPGRAGFHFGKDENAPVSCYLEARPKESALTLG
jgi:tetratricopeptide (TPR) repeat protein